MSISSSLSTLFPSKEHPNSLNPTVTRTLKFGGALLLGWVIAPFIFAAVGGLIGLGLALLVWMFGLKLMPWLSMKAANLGLKMIKYEAWRNPIETMQGVAAERSETIKEAEGQARKFSGEVRNYEQQLVKMKNNYPEEAPRFEAHLQAMQTLLTRRYAAIRTAKAGLAEYERQIEKMDVIWRMTKASDALSVSAGKLTRGDAIQKIKSDEAFKAVEFSMATSFAELDHLMNIEIDEVVSTPLASRPTPVPLVEARAGSGLFVAPDLVAREKQPTK